MEDPRDDCILLPCFLPLVLVFQDLEELTVAFYPFPAGKGPATCNKRVKGRLWLCF